MSGYFDYNATNPTRPEVVEAVSAAMTADVGNPSSMHAAGRRARLLLDDARAQVAALVGAQPRAVVFTSGATEANNLALHGFAVRHPDGAIVTTEIDHVSILAPAASLRTDGYRVEVLPVDRDGTPDYARIRALTETCTCLVATSWANGESGHVCDVSRLTASVADRSLLHLDAAQAAGRIPVHVGGGVHMLSLSAHKFGGPRGVGALVLDCEATEIAPLLRGGPQEGGLRPGTENLAGITGLGSASSCAVREMQVELVRLSTLRERLWTRLEREVAGILRISPTDGLPNTLTVALSAIGGDVLTAALDLRGFAVSTGAACAAGAPEPSHVVRGLGIAEGYRRGVVRMSMGRRTSPDDVERLADAFADIVRHARKAA